jgi:uncharacterized protein involved in propanediol utilization
LALTKTSSRLRAPPVHSGVCHGTLGELLQGPVQRDGRLEIGLISLPVQRYSCVHFVHGESHFSDAGFGSMDKCRRAIDFYLAHYGCDLPAGRWLYDSELSRGKGMSSSTADIVATVRCLDDLFGVRSPPTLIADLLRRIERSDSVYLDRYALYLSARQEVVRLFRVAPRFHTCYVEEDYTIDTESTADALLAHYARRWPDYEANLTAAVAAFERGDLPAIAVCATRSAELGQEVLPKQHHDALRAEQRRFGADGIFVAHTGSVLGYLFVEPLDWARMGELAAFFRGLGHQCRFVTTGL